MDIALDFFENPVLTKRDIAQHLCEQVGLSLRESKHVVESIYDIVMARLSAGEEVKITGFGNFNLREKAARPGRNPRTGAFQQIAPRRVVTFHVSNKLKAKLDGEGGVNAINELSQVSQAAKA